MGIGLCPILKIKIVLETTFAAAKGILSFIIIKINYTIEKLSYMLPCLLQIIISLFILFYIKLFHYLSYVMNNYIIYILNYH